MGKTIIDSDVCKGCGYCVKYCPKKILELGTHINSGGYKYCIQTRPEECIGCGICAMMCPDLAISVYK